MPLISLQYLRAIAALMVVCVHLHVQVERMGHAGAWPDWAASGVDIFFVLSGFLMWATTAGRNQGAGEFYRRRVVRIVPLYWLLTSVVVAVLVFAPRLMQSVRLDPLNLLGSYLFFFAPAPTGLVMPVLVVGWTLNYEMMFYLVFGLALALPKAWRFTVTAGVIGALVLMGFAPWMAGPVARMYTDSIMLDFVFGMALAAGWSRLPAGIAPRCAAPAGMTLLALGFVGLAGLWGMPGLARAVTSGLPAAMVVGGALLLERSGWLPRVPGLRPLGDSSYSLYLSHPIVLSAFAQAWQKAGLHQLPGGMWWFCAAAVVLCVVAGGAVYRCIEWPLTRYFGAFTGARLDSPERA